MLTHPGVPPAEGGTGNLPRDRLSELCEVEKLSVPIKNGVTVGASPFLSLLAVTV